MAVHCRSRGQHVVDAGAGTNREDIRLPRVESSMKSRNDGLRESATRIDRDMGMELLILFNAPRISKLLIFKGRKSHRSVRFAAFLYMLGTRAVAGGCYSFRRLAFQLGDVASHNLDVQPSLPL